jgi:hypothetical protein
VQLAVLRIHSRTLLKTEPSKVSQLLTGTASSISLRPLKVWSHKNTLFPHAVTYDDVLISVGFLFPIITNLDWLMAPQRPRVLPNSQNTTSLSWEDTLGCRRSVGEPAIEGRRNNEWFEYKILLCSIRRGRKFCWTINICMMYWVRRPLSV